MAKAGELLATVVLKGIDTVEKQLKTLGDNLGKAEKGFHKTGDKLKSVGDGFKKAGEALVPMSAGFIALGGASIHASEEIDGALSFFQTKLGATGGELDMLSGTLEKVSATGVGSFDEIANGIVSLQQNMKGLKPQELEDLTVQAMHLADVMDVDVSEITRSAGTLMQQFGIDGQKAFDLIAKGNQKGLDFSGEFLDSLNEYSVHFEQLGFSAEDMFNVMIDGAESGAWNLDKVGDAIKEFGVRAVDGSDASADAFKGLGLNSKKMFKDFSAGGETAQSAFMATMGALSKVDDEVKRNEMGVALFGTMYEDLGRDVVGSFANIENSMGDYSGTAEKVASDNQTFGQMLKGAWNELQFAIKPVGEVLLKIAKEYLPPLLSAVKSLAERFANLSPAGQKVVIAFGGLMVILPAILMGLGTLISIIGSVVGTVGTIVGAFGKLATAGAKIVAVFKKIVVAVKAVMAFFVANPFIVIAVALVAVAVLIYKYWDEIVAFTKAIFNALGDWFKPYWEQFTQWIKDVVAKAKQAWKDFTESFEKFMKDAGDKVRKIWTDFTEAFKQYMADMKARASQALEDMKTSFNNGVKAITDFVNRIATSAKETFAKVKQSVADAWNTAKANTMAFINAVKQFFTDLKNFVVNVFNNVVKSIKQAMTNAKNAISSMIGVVKNVLTNILNVYKFAFNSIFNVVKTIISGIITVISSVIKTVVNVNNRVLSVYKSVFTGVYNTVSSAVTKVKNVIGSIWDKAKSIADKIKGAFTNIFTGIKIPKFSMGGWKVSDLPKLPKMSVQWNAKGGILDHSTLIGAGEKGAEAIVPLSSQRRMKPFAQAISKFMPDDAGAKGVYINIDNMTVRDETDIRKVSQELYKLMERDKKGGGGRR